MAASMGAVLLAGGHEGQRGSRCLNSRIMNPSAERRRRCQASDISIQAKEILRLKKQLNESCPTHRPPVDRIEKDMERTIT